MVQIGLEQAITVLYLPLQLLRLFLYHPAFDSLLFFDFSGFFLRRKLLNQQTFIFFSLIESFPKRLNEFCSSIFKVLYDIFTSVMAADFKLRDASTAPSFLMLFVDHLSRQSRIELT